MILEGKYKFESFDVELENPEVELNVKLWLTVDGSKHSILLKEIDLSKLGYDAEGLMIKVLEKIKENKV